MQTLRENGGGYAEWSNTGSNELRGIRRILEVTAAMLNRIIPVCWIGERTNHFVGELSSPDILKRNDIRRERYVAWG